MTFWWYIFSSPPPLRWIINYSRWDASLLQGFYSSIFVRFFTSLYSLLRRQVYCPTKQDHGQILRRILANREVCLHRFSLWGKSRYYLGLLKSKKKNVGSHAFFKDSEATIILKKSCVKCRTTYGIFFPSLNSVIFRKCVVTLNFLFGVQRPLLRSVSPA